MAEIDLKAPITAASVGLAWRTSAWSRSSGPFKTRIPCTWFGMMMNSSSDSFVKRSGSSFHVELNNVLNDVVNKEHLASVFANRDEVSAGLRIIVAFETDRAAVVDARIVFHFEARI